MMHDLLTSPFLVFPAAAVFGFGFGLFYFGAIRQTAEQIAGRGGWLRPAVFTLARLAAAILLFAFMARLGAFPLLAAFGGFIVSRAVARRGATPARPSQSPEAE
ncbi:N-ATPase subunit AtpR [Ferrovibrio xuzhouensis]|uniref:ATP synthase subunit I n=1 Tax=Ferrovibrio xuzhouensis TaxID=1576914 RepID=A0ABV7VE42_9PROT